MPAYSCTVPNCGWEPPDIGAPNHVKMPQLNAHRYEAHPEIPRPHGVRKGKRGATPSNGSTVASGPQVMTRVTGETIILPGDLFLPYYMLKANHPLYTASKAEWLVHVVSVQTLDYAEEYGLDIAAARFIAKHLPGQADSAGDPIEDPIAAEAL